MIVSMIVAIMLSFVFPTMWLVNGGTYGRIPYYIIINAGIIALLLSGLKRKIIFPFALIVGILMVIEYHSPDLIIEYDSMLTRHIDFAAYLSAYFPLFF